MEEKNYISQEELERFDDYLTKSNDLLDNATYKLMQMFVPYDPEDPPKGDRFDWDMELIGKVEDRVEQVLQEAGINVCHPFYYETDDGDRIPCFLTGQCTSKVCLLK